jgi:hypothetical protein
MNSEYAMLPIHCSLLRKKRKEEKSAKIVKFDYFGLSSNSVGDALRCPGTNN